MASAVKTRELGIKVRVREGETVRAACRRLQREIERSDGRRSHKRRYGYHEKPSELRRKKAKFCRRQIQAGGGLGLSIHPHRALWARSGPTNALMR